MKQLSLFGRCLLVLALFAGTSMGVAQEAYDNLSIEPVGYQQDNPDGGWTLFSDYLLYTPAEYESTGDPFPVLFFLHGAGSRGSDLSKVAKNAPLAQAENGQALPFIIAGPQCKTGKNWSTAAAQEELMQFIREVVDGHNVDPDRIYICGQSMGGRGTWTLLNNNPDYFAAAMPICGGNELSWAGKLVDIPIWVFHGALDKTVAPEYSINMVNAIAQAGGTRIKFTLYPDVGHSSWYRAFKEPDIYDWMLSQVKGQAAPHPYDEFGDLLDGWSDTHDFLDWVMVDNHPWVWCERTANWAKIPYPWLYTDGAWVWFAASS
jgi:dienelactone hydrolase